jgi:hypothetical protein
MIGVRMKMQEQMERLVAALDELGVTYEQAENGMVTFQNSGGECQVFPSQTYDGKLFVRYVGHARVDTAIDALIRCGMLRDMAE